MNSNRATIEVLLKTPESQESFREIVSALKGRFRKTHLSTNIVSKKLVPVNIIVELGVQVSALLLYDVVRELIKGFSRRKLPLRLDFESRYNLAQSYLLRNGVRRFMLRRKADDEDVSTYHFTDSKGNAYHLKVHANGSCNYEMKPRPGK